MHKHFQQIGKTKDKWVIHKSVSTSMNIKPSNAEKLQIQTKMKQQSFKQLITSAPAVQRREAPRDAGDVDADPPERKRTAPEES